MVTATDNANTIGVVTAAEPAAAMLHPLRRRILETLREPHSATSVAQRIGVPRQKVNYHLRELERHGLLQLVEERRKGNCTERIFRTRARYYVISPEAVGRLAADPEQIQDRFSSAYLTALVARALRELGEIREKADRQDKRLATYSLETEVRFASAADRAAFADELAAGISTLVEKYHDVSVEGGRSFRLMVGSYPSVDRPAKNSNDGDSNGAPKEG